MADARDRQSDLAVMEKQEFQQKRLLSRIIDGRDRFDEIANKARERYIAGDIDIDGRNTLLLYACQDYIETAWTLLLNHSRGEDGDSSYLLEAELGSIEMPGDNDDVEFNGLYAILTADELYHCEHTSTVSYRHGPDREQTVVESFSVPRSVTREAVRTMDEFLAVEMGIELKVDDMDDSIESFGFSTAQLEQAANNVETMDQIKEVIATDIDDRILREDDRPEEAATNGESAE